MSTSAGTVSEKAPPGAPKSKGLLERLAEGPVVGDGSFSLTLEKRGYVMAGKWTPEAVIEYPDAVTNLHREFLRAGSDVMQSYTFYGSEDCFAIRRADEDEVIYSWEEVNRHACKLARDVANEGDALVAGCLSPVEGYAEGKGKEHCQDQFRKQVQVFCESGVDFLLGEFFGHTEEAEWAIEEMAKSKLPVACTMRICFAGDEMGIKPDEAAVRMVRAGADVVGVNCAYDPTLALKTIAEMKKGLEKAGLKAYLMAQPLGFHTQDLAEEPRGYQYLPEFPFALEPRLLSRVDVRQFARKAYELGVRYIGGCCGFESYHIRAIAEELTKERGREIPGRDKSEGYRSLLRATVPYPRKRANAEYWDNLVVAVGRENIKNFAVLTD